MGKPWKIIALLLCTLFPVRAQTTVYLFPGQGSDALIFSEIKWDTAYRIVHIQYPVPAKGTTLRQFSELVAQQVDTAVSAYIFVGVSLGGMICSELSETYHPKKIILISSAKCRSELPFRYRFQKYIPIYKLIPPFMIKGGALLLQPLVEPDRRRYKAVFKSMLKSKSPRYLKRTIAMIVNWDKKLPGKNIWHIHGSSDHTLPLRHVKADAVLHKGSHMMTLTRHEEMTTLLKIKMMD